MKSTTVRLLAMLLLAGLAAGCGPKGPTLRIAQFMTDPNLIRIISQAVAEIEKKHPGVHIRVESVPYNDFGPKIMTQFSAGNAPDVIFVEVNNFVDLYSRGVFEDLDPYLKKDKIDLKGYYPAVLKRFSPDGHLYAMPQDTAPEGLVYYNKKAFREAGLPFPDGKWSWPQPFLSVCQKLVKKDKDGHIVRWAFNDAYEVRFQNFLYSNGGNWVDDTAHPTRLTLDTPQALEAVQFRYDLIHKYHVSPSPGELQTMSQASGAEEMFVNGQVAMITSGIWHTPKFLQAKDLEWDVTSFPSGPKGKKGWGSGGSGYGLVKTSKNKDLAWEVIKEITSTETIAKLAQTGMLQPALIQLANSDAFLKSPGAAHKSVLLKMPADSHYNPFLSDWSEIYWGMLTPEFDRLWNGTKQPKDVLPDLNKKVNQKFFKK